MIKYKTNKWIAGDPLNADDINDTFDVSSDILEATIGETIADRKCVYQKESDGKIYLTDSDNFDEKLYSFLGIIYESGILNDIKKIRYKGIVEGLSGLTAGRTYCLAKAGSSDADITKTYSGSTGNQSVGHDGGTSDNRQGYSFTITNPTKLTKLTLNLLKKIGSPTGNLVATIYFGQPSGSSPAGGLMSTGYVATLPATSLTTSYASYDLTFTDTFLVADTYTVILSHDTLSSGNYMQLDRDSNTDSSFYRYPSGGVWANSGGRTTYTLDFLAETFSLGDLTEYFFDYKKVVGKAISTTKLLLSSGKNIGNPISKTKDTPYTAETDGFIQVYENNTGSTVTFQIYIDGVQYGDWSTSANSQNGTVTVPISKGSKYIVNASGTPIIYFIPNF